MSIIHAISNLKRHDKPTILHKLDKRQIIPALFTEEDGSSPKGQGGVY